MKEFDVRRAIGLDETLTTAQKYTLIMLCTRLDWHTWTGQVSARDIAKVSSQGERQVKRHLASLKKAGWLERLVELRSDTPRLHHKADTRLNVELVKIILDGRPQTAPPAEIKPSSVTHDTSGENDTSGESDMGDKSGKGVESVTDVINDTSGESDTEGVSDVTLEGCHKRHWGSVISDTGGVSLSPPNINIDQYNNNNNQSNINSSEPEPEPRVKRGLLEDGFEWCERCKRHVSMDEPHTYPHSKLICSDEEPTPEQVKALEWDGAWGAPEVKVSSEVKRGDLFYFDEIHDELNYKREVLDILNDYGRHDVRLCLWNRQDGDKLFKEMMEAKVAPRSVIDWVTVYYGGEATGDTPSKPKPPTSFKVTVDQQRKILEADQAWMSGATNGDSNAW